MLAVEGLKVHAVGWGGADGQPPIGREQRRRLLLLHGLGGTSIHWELAGGRLAERLRAHVTAIDLAGFGRTRARSEQASVFANARLVAALAAELEKEIRLLLDGCALRSEEIRR